MRTTGYSLAVLGLIEDRHTIAVLRQISKFVAAHFESALSIIVLPTVTEDLLGSVPGGVPMSRPLNGAELCLVGGVLGVNIQWKLNCTSVTINGWSSAGNEHLRKRCFSRQSL